MKKMVGNIFAVVMSSFLVVLRSFLVILSEAPASPKTASRGGKDLLKDSSGFALRMTSSMRRKDSSGFALRMTSFIVLIGFMGVMMPVAYAVDFSSTNFEVKNPVIEELSGFATSTSFQLWGTIPYISPRISTSTSFVLSPGFLNFPSSAVTTTTTPTSTPEDEGSGGGSMMPPGLCRKADFNQDGWIDFVDFSILLYYYDKTGEVIRPYDLNGDMDINIVDISIFMYYWNGGRIRCIDAPPKQN